jgi:hypothetical protein
MSRKLSNVSRVEMQTLNSDLLSCFTPFTGGTMKMTQDQLIKFAVDCELVEAKKLPESEVALMFSKVKLGKKTEIDFERFQECLRMMAVAKGIPYHQIIADSIRDRAIQQDAPAPTSRVGGGRAGTIAEYANKLKFNVQILELKDGQTPAQNVNIEELAGLAKQVLFDSQQYLRKGI